MTGKAENTPMAKTPPTAEALFFDGTQRPSAATSVELTAPARTAQATVAGFAPRGAMRAKKTTTAATMDITASPVMPPSIEPLFCSR